MRRRRRRALAKSTDSRAPEPGAGATPESEASEPTSFETTETGSTNVDERSGSDQNAPLRAQKTARARYDEGVDLLKDALDQVRHHRPRPVNLPTKPGEPRGRRGGNGQRNGNGRGNGRHAQAVPAETAETAEPAENEDIDALDSERPDVRRRRQRAARHRAEMPAPVDPGVGGEIEANEGADEVAPGPGLAGQAEPGDAGGETAGVALEAPDTSEEAEPAAALDPVLVETPDLVAHARSRPEPFVHQRGRDRKKVVALVAALALAAAGVLAVVTIADRGADETAGRDSGLQDPAPARFVFDAIPLTSGATVQREWSLRASDGSRFEGSLTFSNPTEAPATVSHTEVIPKTLASSVDDIDFDPDPVVIEADPVVQFDVTVPAEGTVTATYRIDVAPDGSERSRLEEWAEDLDAELAQRAAATTTTTTAAPPPETAPPPPAPSGGSSTGTSPGGRGAPPAPAAPSPARGTIVIAKRSQGGPGTFGFSGSGGSVSVTTSGSPVGTGQAAVSVSPGSYSWTEALPPGWALSGVDCSDKEAGPFEHRSTTSGATATFNVQAGETVVCTWVNQKTG